MRVVTLRLDINGESYFVSNFDKSALQISRKVTSLDNLSNQETKTKETFRVPLTGELIDAIGFITDFSQEAKVNLNKKIDGQILINDFPYYTGSFQILQLFTDLKGDIAEAEMIFKGNETSLKQELSEITMAELLDGETTPYKVQEIRDYQANQDNYRNNNGIFWPLVDYGQRFTGDTSATSGTILGSGQTALTQLDFKPAVTFKKLFELFPVDITWDSSIDDLVENQGILLHNNESRQAVIDTSPKDYTGYMTNNAKTRTLNSSLSGVYNSPLIFDNKVVYNQDNFNLTTSQYETPVSGDYIIRVKANVTAIRRVGTTSNTWTFRFWVLNTAIGNRQYLTGRTVNLNTVLSSQSIRFDVTYIQPQTFFTNNMQVQIEVINSSGEQIDVNFPQDEFKFQVIQTPGINNNSNLVWSDNAPELNCFEILRTIIGQCNGIIEQNEEGVYNIIPWVEWIDNKDENRFINDKVDNSRSIRIRPFSIQGAKKITLSYAENEDLYSKAFADNQGIPYGTFQIQDTGTDLATKEYKIELLVALPPFSFIPFTSAIVPKLYDDNFETVKGKPLLMQAYDTANFNIVIDTEDAVDGTVLDSSFVFYPYCGQWTDLNGGWDEKDYAFGTNINYFAAQNYPQNTLYERFWKKYIQETYSEQAREVKLDIHDSLQNVETTEFNERYYFKGAQFRLTEYDNFSLTSDQSFSIRLMKRIDIENIDIAPLFPDGSIDGVIQWRKSIDNTVPSPADGSSEPAADVEASAKAYGYAYDSNLNVAIQRGGILTL